MHPFLADAIDFPIVIQAGIVVLVPLMAFEVFVEAFVLRKAWEISFGQLCTLTFFANCWSLLAGIPTKILNAFLYGYLLPNDIPGFFKWYPYAIALGSLIYFAVTIWVEGVCARRWLEGNGIVIGRRRFLRGILLANIATYAVLTPGHYYFTRPESEILEFTNHTRWTSHPSAKILFVDFSDGHLKSVQLNDSKPETIVPMPMTDYLVSADLGVCAFRGVKGNLYFYERQRGQTNLIWKTDERFFMNQVAFSPSGERIAFASEKENSIEIVDVPTGKRTHLPLIPEFDFHGPSVAWSSEETTFFVRGFDKNVRFAITIRPDGNPLVVTLEGSNIPPVLTCYGRTGDARRYGGGDWGVSYHADTCDDLSVVSWPGLSSGLTFYRGDRKTEMPFLTISVRAGLMHLAAFYFGDVAFLQDCSECLFESNGYIYLLDINKKQLGTLVRGDRFIELTPRYEKKL